MASPTLPYTLTNGTTADATQVQANDQALLDGITDGTKDLNISALTAAGTATLNGNVVLGNATSDTISTTGRFSTALIPSVASTNDLGTSALPFGSIYTDNGATDGGAIYFDAGTSKYIKSNAAGTILTVAGFTTYVNKADGNIQARALCRYNSAGPTITVLSGFGVTSIAYSSAGIYTVTLSITMSDALYNVQANIEKLTYHAYAQSKTTTTFDFISTDTTSIANPTDATRFEFIVVGQQA